MDGLSLSNLLPPSLAFLKVSGELSLLFLCRLMRSQVLPVQLMQQQALKTDYYEWKVRLPMANLKTKEQETKQKWLYDFCLLNMGAVTWPLND